MITKTQRIIYRTSVGIDLCSDKFERLSRAIGRALKKFFSLVWGLCEIAWYLVKRLTDSYKKDRHAFLLRAWSIVGVSLMLGTNYETTNAFLCELIFLHGVLSAVCAASAWGTIDDTKDLSHDDQ